MIPVGLQSKGSRRHWGGGALAASLCLVASCVTAHPTPTEDDDSQSVTDPPSYATKQAGGDAPSHAIRYDSVAIWLDVPDTVQLGETLSVTLTLMNIADRPVELTTLRYQVDGRLYDAMEIEILDLVGRRIWSRIYDSAPPMGRMTPIRLDPLEVLEIREDVYLVQDHRKEPPAPHAVRLEPGRYQVVARFIDATPRVFWASSPRALDVVGPPG